MNYIGTNIRITIWDRTWEDCSHLSVDNPKDPIDEEVVKLSMAQIIASDIFTSGSGKFISAKGARVVDRSVTDYELV